MQTHTSYYVTVTYIPNFSATLVWVFFLFIIIGPIFCHKNLKFYTKINQNKTYMHESYYVIVTYISIIFFILFISVAIVVYVT